MTEAVSRVIVDEFYQAYAARDIKRTAEFLAEDVKWTISGPIDVLMFCGVHHGKAAVCDMMERLVPQIFDIVAFQLNTMLIDGNQVATLNRLSAKRKDDGRLISYRLAHFMRFREDKVVENLSLLDSFDAVEQVLGHALTAHGQNRSGGNLVAV